MSPSTPVSFYLTFSPLPFPRGLGGFFLLRLLRLARCWHAVLSVFPLGSMVLCVARTFLSPLLIRVGTYGQR